MQFMGRWPSPVGTTPRSGYQTDGEPGNDSAGVGTKTHRRGLDENPAPHIVAPDINEGREHQIGGVASNSNPISQCQCESKRIRSSCAVIVAQE